jgi:pyridoxine 5-phosphate synthase
MRNPVTLVVNIDHAATLRQARQSSEPDPVAVALLAELGGADAISVFLREDRKHVQDRDVALLRRTVKTRFHLAVAPTPEMLRVAFDIKPDVLTLVPEKRTELTTEPGLDLVSGREALKKFVVDLKAADVSVHAFIDANVEQVQMAARLGFDGVELHAGRFADARTADVRAEELRRIVDAAKTAAKLKLRCVVGHGVDVKNAGTLAAIEEVDSVHVGHSVMARALLVGVQAAVRDMLTAVRR